MPICPLSEQTCSSVEMLYTWIFWLWVPTENSQRVYTMSTVQLWSVTSGENYEQTLTKDYKSRLVINSLVYTTSIPIHYYCTWHILSGCCTHM